MIELYKINVQQESELRQYELKLAKYRQNNVSANAIASPTQSSVQNTNQTTNVELTVKSIIKVVEEIPSSALSDDDKEKLKEFVYSLEGIRGAKDKSKFWEKSKEVLKFLADKTMDAAVAVLPYIIFGMHNIA